MVAQKYSTTLLPQRLYFSINFHPVHGNVFQWLGLFFSMKIYKFDSGGGMEAGPPQAAQ